MKPKILPKPIKMARPKRLTLEARKACYKGHKMSEDNKFRYQGGTWCRKCRALSRLKSRPAAIARQKTIIAARRKEAKAALAEAFKPKGKVASLRSPSSKLVRQSERRKAARKVKASPNGKDVPMFSHTDAGKGTVKAA